MKRLIPAVTCFFAFVSIGLIATAAMADPDHKISVPVAFGFGLNTAQQGNPLNDVILPDKIKVKQNGVVHFLVAGTHQVFVYNPGKGDIDDPNLNATYINDLTDLYYQGILPTAGGNPVTTNPSNARNRVESVSFTEPGTYLVICNIRNHFNNGMFALVEVEKGK